jgi:hypothetical protein
MSLCESQVCYSRLKGVKGLIIDEYLVKEGLLDNCIVSVDADGTEVENRNSTARHVHRVVQLNIKSTVYKKTVHLLFCYQSEV